MIWLMCDCLVAIKCEDSTVSGKFPAAYRTLSKLPCFKIWQDIETLVFKIKMVRDSRSLVSEY